MYFEYWPESGCLCAEFVFCKISHITPGGAGERRRAGAESLASLVLITTTCTPPDNGHTSAVRLSSAPCLSRRNPIFGSKVSPESPQHLLSISRGITITRESVA